MSKASPDAWRQYEKEILESLDILGEYKKLGLRVASDHKTAKGWVRCYSLFREDNTASAGVCVEGQDIGHYKDFGGVGGGYVDLFKMVAQKRPTATNCGDRKKVRDEYAALVGIKRPDAAEKSRSTDTFVPFGFDGRPADQHYKTYSEFKSGVTREGLEGVGVLVGTYPRNWRIESRSVCFAAPMYGGDALLDSPPTGYHLFTVDPRRKVRKFGGKDKPHEEVKTLTVGTYGLMGLDGLQRLKDATHVWLVEGISDLLAVQSIIDKSLPHVVMTAGGCNQTPKEKWLNPHFMGKTIYVCFDVGDADNQGQKGAAVWCEAASRYAKQVKNILLPASQDSGKNDLRAWLSSGGRKYQDMLSLAAITDDWRDEPREADAVEGISVSPSSGHQAIMDRLGCIVGGQIEGTGSVEIYSARTFKRMVIKSLNSFHFNEAVMMFGADTASSVISLKKEVEDGKVSLFDVRTAIAAMAADKTVSEKNVINAGIWDMGSELLLVGSGIAHRVTKGNEMISLDRPLYGRKRVDLANGADWYKEAWMSAYLDRARDQEFRKATFNELVAFFARWDNWEFSSNAAICAALFMASCVQNVWEFRPQIIVTGPSGSGKSTLMQRALPQLFGKLAEGLAKPTEAVLRQTVGNTSLVAIADEFDKSKPHDRTAILEMVRNSGWGGNVGKGSTSGKDPARWNIKHIFWLAGIESGIQQEADNNRFIRLELKRLPRGREMKKRLQLPDKHQTEDLGRRAIATAITICKEANASCSIITKLCRPNVDMRYIESLATPAAVYAHCCGHSVEDAAAWIDAIIESRQICETQSNDEESLISSIQSSKVSESGRMYPIALLVKWVMEDSPGTEYSFNAETMLKGSDADRLLQSNGIRVMREEGEVFLYSREVSRFLLQNCDFGKAAIAEILCRIDGATKCKRRVCGHPRNGVALPVSVFYRKE